MEKLMLELRTFGFYPYNPKLGQEMQSDADGVKVDRSFIAHLSWADPVVADTDRILNDQVTSSTETTVVTTFLAQPDYARQISITPGGTTTDVSAGDIVVVGTDQAGDALTENVAIAADATSAVNTTNAFKTVTSITFPIQDGAGATYDVGITDKLGLPYALSHDTVLKTFLNHAEEVAAPTVTVDATDWQKNLIDLNSALDGNQVDVYLIA